MPRDHGALIEQTRPHRITRETTSNMRARTRVCAWCGRFATKGQQWCERHAPGYAGDRRKSEGGDGARLVAARDDFVAELMLSDGLKSWAPIARIVAMRPRHVRPVKMSHVVRALVSRAEGDHEPWSEIVASMRAHGIMRDSDREFPWHA